MSRLNKAEIAAAAMLVRTRRARTDFGEFFETVWLDAKGRPVKLAEFQRNIWVPALEAPRLFLESARGHGKSTIISMAYPIWRLGQDPNLRIKLIAQSDVRARERILEIKRVIETNPMLKLVFPDLRIDPKAEDSKSKFSVVRTSNAKDASIEALGVTTASSGSRSDILLFDDVVDMRNSILQPQLRETVLQKVLGDFIPTLSPQGQIVWVGTPWTMCLHPTTRVRTPRGRVAISELRPTDQVEISAGIWDVPKLYHRREFHGELQVVRLWNIADPLRLTH